MRLRITVNGSEASVGSDRLDQVLDELGFSGATVATALNEEFVAKLARSETRLSDGDRLEVVAPLQGG